MAKAPIVVAVASDHHIGSTVGLAPPTTQLNDGGTYRASREQRWLWKNWQDFCRRAIDTADTWKGNLITVFNGDIIETDHKLRSDQVITRNKATLVGMTYEVLRPLVDYSEQVYVIRGTEAHVGPSGEYEEMIAADLTNAVAMNKKKGIYSWWDLELDVNGTTFDIAHHGKLGQMPHTKLNGAMSLAGQIIHEYFDEGRWPPNVVIRSHLHRAADTYDNWNYLRYLATPGWQLATAFVHRIVKGKKRPQIGGLIFTCWPDGHYDVEKVRYWPPVRRPVKVKT